MEIGNWQIDNESIKWNTKGLNRFVIPFDTINDTQPGPANEKFYKWILLATNEDWLTEDDLYDLNYAFVYAMAKSGKEFNYAIFDETVAEQFEQFDAEDDEQCY